MSIQLTWIARDSETCFSHRMKEKHTSVHVQKWNGKQKAIWTSEKSNRIEGVRLSESEWESGENGATKPREIYWFYFLCRRIFPFASKDHLLNFKHYKWMRLFFSLFCCRHHYCCCCCCCCTQIHWHFIHLMCAVRRRDRNRGRGLICRRILSFFGTGERENRCAVERYEWKVNITKCMEC